MSLMILIVAQNLSFLKKGFNYIKLLATIYKQKKIFKNFLKLSVTG